MEFSAGPGFMDGMGTCALGRSLEDGVGTCASARSLEDGVGSSTSTRSLDDGVGASDNGLSLGSVHHSSRARKPSSIPIDLETGGDAARTAVAAPRLTRGYEFEDEQLETKYTSYKARHGLEARTGHVAVSVALMAFTSVSINVVAGCDDRLLLAVGYIYGGCWLAYARYAHLAASRGVPLGRVENVFVGLCVVSNTMCILLYGGLRTTPLLGRGEISIFQIFIVALAAAYAQLNVSHCAVIACAGTFGVALNTISVRINTTMRTAYHYCRAVEADASEREQMLQHEVEVELKLRTAEAAKAARGSLIRMVMHDLRSPLLSVANAVAIVLNMMPETRIDDSDVVECLRAMATCSQLMQHIVSDMLDFERIDSGRLVLVPAAMRVSQLLKAAADTFGGLAAAKGITLCLVPLLSDLEQTVFIGDVRRLQQCVNNGVSNSIKFTEAGGTVTIRAWRGDDAQVQAESNAATTADWNTASAAAKAIAKAKADAPHASVMLEVDDSGVGLTANELHVLNQGEAFTQVGLGQLQGSGGSGLGLTIARELLKLHGAAKSKSQARPQLRFPPGFRVLHVEDDAVLRRTFELRVLKKLGVPFDVAVNGAEAVSYILEEKREYALVLMDNQMPVLTGEKATRALRAGGFEGVIVGMTGDPHGCSERDDFEAAGLSFCFDKDTPGIHHVAQVLGSFALNEGLDEKPGAGSSSSPP
ncbi:hypothetical protein T492DRAFT_912042 [Pavlovales sp. CCMP2436]|nr:hypothetical protein T492DRAFT_912042 [Pavlovales sp. CCMP2436]